MNPPAPGSAPAGHALARRATAVTVAAATLALLLQAAGVNFAIHNAVYHTAANRGAIACQADGRPAPLHPAQHDHDATPDTPHHPSDAPTPGEDCPVHHLAFSLTADHLPAPAPFALALHPRPGPAVCDVPARPHAQPQPITSRGPPLALDLA